MDIEFAPEFLEMCEQYRKYHAIDFIPGTAERATAFITRFFEFKGLFENATNALLSGTDEQGALASYEILEAAIEAQQLAELCEDLSTGMRLIALLLKDVADLDGSAEDAETL